MFLNHACQCGSTVIAGMPVVFNNNVFRLVPPSMVLNKPLRLATACHIPGVAVNCHMAAVSLLGWRVHYQPAAAREFIDGISEILFQSPHRRGHFRLCRTVGAKPDFNGLLASNGNGLTTEAHITIRWYKLVFDGNPFLGSRIHTGYKYRFLVGLIEQGCSHSFQCTILGFDFVSRW